MAASSPDSYARTCGAQTDTGVIGVRIYSERNRYECFSSPTRSCGGGMKGGGLLGMDTPKGLGTAFGQEMEDRVNRVHFERGSVLANIMIRYNDAEGFTAEGIPVPPLVRVKNPWPGESTGCTPPPNWKR